MAENFISGEEHQNIKNSRNKNRTRVTISVNHIVLAGVIAIVCILSFLAGVAYQKHHNPISTISASSNGSSSGFPGGNGFGRHRLGGLGTVTNISSTSISINNMRTGTTSTYTIDPNTSITDGGQTIPVTTIQNGDTVLVNTSSSTSTVASHILVNPSFGSGPSTPPTSGSQTSN